MKTYEEIREAIGAHGLWKGRLKQSIETRSTDTQPNIVQQDTQCKFGKWLFGPSVTSEEKKSPHYAECRDLHRKFHQAAASVLTLALAGKTQEANLAMAPNSEFGRLSMSLTRAMTLWHDALAGEKTAK